MSKEKVLVTKVNNGWFWCIIDSGEKVASGVEPSRKGAMDAVDQFLCSRKTRRIILEVDEEDYRAINQAIARRQLRRLLPDGKGNQSGRCVAEVCRGWMELLDSRSNDTDGEDWKFA